MTISPVTLVAACALLACALGVVRAQDGIGPVPPETPGRVFGNGVLPEYLAIYDADGSGVFSVEELQAIDADRRNRHRRFRDRWDTNHDGRISLAERDAARATIRTIIRQRRLARFHEVDTNGDEVLILSEFTAINAVAVSDSNTAGMAEALFNHIDRSGNGEISKEEFLRSLEDQPVEPTVDPDAKPPAHSRRTLDGR